MPTVLLTLGRLPKALTLARALHSAGWRVIIAEPFSWHVARVSRAVARCYQIPAPNHDIAGFNDALLDIIRRENVSWIVPVSEETQHVLALRPRLPPSITVLGPTMAEFEALAEKLSFAQRVRARHLTAPITYRVNDPRAQTLLTSSQCIAKPDRGCSGIGIQTIEKGSELPNLPADTLIQQFIAGRPFSSLTLVHAGREIATVVYEGKVFAGSVAVCFERVDEADAIKCWISQFIEDLSFSGFVSLDFIVDADGTPWAIECNPRLTSGIHFFEPKAFATALSDTSVTAVPYNNKRRWQWGYSTLTEAYGCLFKGRVRDWLKNMKLLRTSRDVVWSFRDPLPFLLMTPLSLPILWPAIVEGISLGEASQRDIAPLWSHRADATGDCNEV